MSEKDLNESGSTGTETGDYIQAFGANGSSIFVIGSGVRNKIMTSIVLTKHLPLESPVQMDLRTRENVKALYSACKRFLEATTNHE